MQVGLYFGSFNPIHVGHCIIASHIAEHTSLEEIWFVVSPQNPFKPSASLLNEFHRLHLVHLAIEGDNRLKVSDIEFKLPKPSYTIDTLAFLQEKYPRHQFSIIVGADSFENIPKWKNGSMILANYPIYIYQRPGTAVEITGQNFHVLSAPLLDISATSIREYVRLRKSIRYLVPEPVREEIERNGYYR